MDTSTGHLVDLNIFDGYEMRRRGLDPGAYSKVPEGLERAAKAKLAGKAEAQVSLTSAGRLSKWAAAERRRRDLKRKNRAAARRRLARASRRANRR
jgi:hypothetical protein